MVDVNKLMQVIKENQVTLSSLAEKIGISYKNFHDKMDRQDFLSSEITVMLQELEFSIDPMQIFFKDVKPIVLRKYEKEEWYQ